MKILIDNGHGIDTKGKHFWKSEIIFKKHFWKSESSVLFLHLLLEELHGLVVGVAGPLHHNLWLDAWVPMPYRVCRIKK